MNSTWDGDAEAIPWFANSIRRDLYQRLGKYERFRVPALVATDIAVRSSSSLVAAAQELRVDLLLEGSLERVGDNVELAVSILEPDGNVKWTQTFLGSDERC